MAGNAVLFDFDGTLYYGTAQLNEWCFARALENMGLPPATPEKINRSVGMTFAQIARLMTGREDAASLSRFEEETFRAVPRYIERFVHRDPQVENMLAQLRREAALAVCSNASPRYLFPMLEALKLAGLFEEIWAHREGVSKAQAIPLLSGRLCADNVVFVGDRLEDVQAARSAGVAVVGMRNAACPWEVDGADIAVDSCTGIREAVRTLLRKKER